MDAYFTAPWMTKALLAHVPEIAGLVLEPCAGDLSIAQELALAPGVTILTNDIDAQRTVDYTYDASLATPLWNDIRYDWIVTNPPYTNPLPLAILQRAYENCRHGVALMLRLSFLEPTSHKFPRGPYLGEYPPHRMLVMPRYSFTGNGKSDSMTTAWMIWSKHPLSGPPIICCHGIKPLTRRRD